MGHFGLRRESSAARIATGEIRKSRHKIHSAMRICIPAATFGLLLRLGSGQAAVQTQPPTFDDLAARTYTFGPEDKRTITLANGAGKETEAGGSLFELMKVHAIGDLDGDKAADAAVLLVESTGGSGRFYYLFVLMNRGGTLVQIEQPEWLGDRSVIERVRIEKGIVAVRFLTHRDQDPACCPTRRVENRYRLVNGKLVGLP